MAATNYTPIQLYYSTTASAAPTAGNLTNGELAINITDGKLYYKDNGGVVQVIATKGAGTIGGSTTQIQYNNAGALAGSAAMTFNSGTNTVTLTTLNLTNALGAAYGGTAQSAYAQGDILYASATNTLAKLGVGTVNYILTSTGSVPQWVAPTSVTVNTATNLAGGAAGSVPYQSGVATTTFLAIGAANTVMTSSGTAPQWGTTLTGLTGLSSSSITNTSLTSGRVVLSTTGGLQADSANLTFNGATLSTTGLSNTGTSTLVKTLTLGNSNFNGTAVFAAATPAKMYMGTGTVTDVTSGASATNAVGTIASLDITPIAATNTGVTYTNASTLYIAGAPSAGTNVTITNPYSLYIAAGASYFGGNITFANSPIYSGGTANGVMYLNGSKQVTTGSALTFDGSTFGVVAAANTKGILVSSSTGNSPVIRLQSGDGYRVDLSILTGGAGAVWNSTDSSPFIWQYAGSEQMRLTSTGLGIGTSSPAYKLDVLGQSRVAVNGGSAQLRLERTGSSTGAGYIGADSTSTFAVYDTSFNQQLVVNPSGNLGLGVTPSAWYANAKVFELQGGSIWSSATSNMVMSQNMYLDTTATYRWKTANPAVYYNQGNGVNSWYISVGTPTVGGAIGSFTQAMTLDASSFLTVVGGATIQGLTVGKGGGAILANTAIGVNALAANTTGNYGTAVGYGALTSNTTGGANNAFGQGALANNTIGAANTAFSNNALSANVSGGNNTAFGYAALGNSGSLATAGAFVVGVSYTIVSVGTTNFVAIGAASNTVGVSFTATGIGTGTGTASPNVNNNTGIGYQTLYNGTVASGNTALGFQAGLSNVSASGQVHVGYQAGYFATGNNVTYVGYGAGPQLATSSGTDNVGIGISALRAVTSGAYNVAVGSGALVANTTGSGNVAIGYAANYLATNRNNTVFIGFEAGYNNVTDSGVGVGYQALFNQTTSADRNVALGYQAGSNISSGSYNLAAGWGAMGSGNTGTGNFNIGLGYSALSVNTSGGNNTSLGAYALAGNTSASNNTAVGYQAGYTNSTATRLTAVGYQAGLSSNNVANTFIGNNAGLYSTGATNTAVGDNSQASGAGALNGTGSDNTSVGYASLIGLTSGSGNTAVGILAGKTISTGSNNTSIGRYSGGAQTAMSGIENTCVGNSAGSYLTTGNYNVFVGSSAGQNNLAGQWNTVVGQGAFLYGTGATNTILGQGAGNGSTFTGSGNILIGNGAGAGLTSGNSNVFIGYTYGGSGSGVLMTSGSKNVIIGSYGGNQGGLDIRTSSNNIVLSDGDGNVRGWFNSSGDYTVGASATIGGTENANVGVTSYAVGILAIARSSVSAALDISKTGTLGSGTMQQFSYNGGVIGSITNTSTTVAYVTSSDYRLKNSVVPMTGALAKVAALKPVTYKWNVDDSEGEGFIAHELAEVCPHAVSGEKDAVDEDGKPKYQGIDTSFLVATLTAAIQELKAEFDAYKATHP